MSTNVLVLVMANLLMLVGMASGQEPAGAADGKKDVGATGVSGLLQHANIDDIVLIATELRKASDSMKSFGESLNEISVVTAEAAGTTSKHLAAIGGEFDPFGFKAAFETIQKQNAIIQAQSQMIIELQQRKIRRLRKENKLLKQPKRESRKRKTSQTRKSSDKAREVVTASGSP